MEKVSSHHHKERVLIVAPIGRDGPLIQKELLAAGITADVCQSIAGLTIAIQEGAGAALIADEALREDTVECLRFELSQQPPWSDFPIIVMTSGGVLPHADRSQFRLFKPLGNVSLLERPLRTVTLVSSMQAALRARRRQYELAAHLERREATERELESRNADLVKANRELEVFAYVASHDLQEPLRMINIYTELLIRDFQCADALAETYANYIQSGILRMENLIRDLLAFARAIRPDSVIVGTADLSKALTQALSILQNRLEENQATIQYADLPQVRGDENQLTQVFQNLLSNALKYRKSDVTPHITVSAEQREAHWVISVTDNGIGFEQEYAKRIFDLFQRLHKEEYPGTGLGLAICQRIVERCGGSIWAEGRVGIGATFSFTLPEVTDA